jgi:hypothetical protein
MVQPDKVGRLYASTSGAARDLMAQAPASTPSQVTFWVRVLQPTDRTPARKLTLIGHSGSFQVLVDDTNIGCGRDGPSPVKAGAAPRTDPSMRC